MTGTVYTVPPIPPDPEHTTYVDAGASGVGRMQASAELAAQGGAS